MRGFLKSKTRYIVFTALFAALTMVATIAVAIPIPAVNGYLNFGDAVILVCAALFGGVPALIAGAVGAALGDLILGYAPWIPFTIIAKGLEGLIAGFFLKSVFKFQTDKRLKILLGVTSMVIGAAIMPVIYFFASWIISGGIGGAAVAIVSDLTQAAASVAIACVLIFVLDLPKIVARVSARVSSSVSPHTASSETPNETPDAPSWESSGETPDAPSRESSGEAPDAPSREFLGETSDTAPLESFPETYDETK
jgi:uncharacterized membrane protein